MTLYVTKKNNEKKKQFPLIHQHPKANPPLHYSPSLQDRTITKTPTTSLINDVLSVYFFSVLNGN